MLTHHINSIMNEPTAKPSPKSGLMPVVSHQMKRRATNHRNTSMKIRSIGASYIKAAIGAILVALFATNLVSAATLLPPGEQTFADDNGAPLAGGTVQFYTPNTTTPKDTWQDADETVLNTNPIILDSGGRAIIYGSGTYREVVKNSLGETIWDQLTASVDNTNQSWGGTSAGSANAQTIAGAALPATSGQIYQFIAGFTNTGPLTLSAGGSSNLTVYTDTISGLQQLVGGEVTTPNLVQVIYDASLTAFHLINPAVRTYPVAPGGRLGLVSGQPVIVADVASATTVYWVPYVNNVFPWYNGSYWRNRTSNELSLALDSNAAHTGYQQNAKAFDLFLYDDSGTNRLISGPAWTTSTPAAARASAISLLNGIYVNTAGMTAKYDTTSATLTIPAQEATYVGTMYMSADGTTLWSAAPAAAAGGGNARLYLWNQYNRVNVTATSLDSTNSWAYTTATWRSADNSTSNRVSVIVGNQEDTVSTETHSMTSNTLDSTDRLTGIGFNVTNALTVGNLSWDSSGAANANVPGLASFSVQPTIGLNFFQWEEYSQAAGTTTWYGDNNDPTKWQFGLVFRGRY